MIKYLEGYNIFLIGFHIQKNTITIKIELNQFEHE